MLHPGVIFGIALGIFVLAEFRLRWPLPLTLLAVAVAVGLLGGFGVPFRHLVEGGFGYYYLVLVLFAGALFGHVMRVSGAVEGVAATLERLAGAQAWLVLALAGALVFLAGMFVGIAGVAVLAAGVFAVPMLRRVGLSGDRAAAFIALQAVFGMLAPPVNVSAMAIADGVNMPFSNFERSLLALSVPSALFTVWYFTRQLPRRSPAPVSMDAVQWTKAAAHFPPLLAVLAAWLLIRGFPEVLPDPSTPFVLLAGVLVALPTLVRRGWGESPYPMFSGPVLFLGAVLVAVGVLVQVMTLTGIRGWLVINAMSLPFPWILAGILVGMPILGGVLTTVGSSNVLGVPFAFAFIHQDMILNVSALSAIAALSEFFPPTAISAVLAGYLVGEDRVGRIFKAALVPMLVLVALAVLMLVFGERLAPFLR